MNLQTTLEERDIDVAEFEDFADQVTGAEYAVQRPMRSMNRPGGQPSTWFPQALRQFRAIERLRAGWDSQGGAPPLPEIVRSGAGLLAVLAEAEAHLAKPEIHPTRSGGVQFHWESGPRYVEIEMLGPSTAQYYYVDNLSHRETEGQLRVGDSLTPLLRLLRAVDQGQ